MWHPTPAVKLFFLFFCYAVVLEVSSHLADAFIQRNNPLKQPFFCLSQGHIDDDSSWLFDLGFLFYEFAVLSIIIIISIIIIVYY